MTRSTSLFSNWTRPTTTTGKRGIRPKILLPARISASSGHPYEFFESTPGNTSRHSHPVWFITDAPNFRLKDKWEWEPKYLDIVLLLNLDLHSRVNLDALAGILAIGWCDSRKPDRLYHRKSGLFRH